MSDKVAIIGYSGHAYVVVDAAIQSGLHVVGYCEECPKEFNPFDLIYLGNEKAADFDWGTYAFILGIGDNKIRSRVAESVKTNGGRLVNVVHPTAWVSSTVHLGSGLFIGANVSINALASVGDQSILNTGCILEHECVLGAAVHLGPGSVLAGKVKVGANTFVGANAVVRQGVTIGENAVIGAGAVVVRDIMDGETVVGNPARKLLKNG